MKGLFNLYMKNEGKKINSRAKSKRIQIRLTEQEYKMIEIALEGENISELIREYLKSQVQERIKNNKELEDKIRENLYSDFFNSK